MSQKLAHLLNKLSRLSGYINTLKKRVLGKKDGCGVALKRFPGVSPTLINVFEISKFINR
jgi:hypothetical protein